MKKTVLLIASILTFYVSASETIDEASVPVEITTEFHKKFPELTQVTWIKCNTNFKAMSIQENGFEWDVFLDENAKLVEVDRNIAYDELPQEFKQKINQEFGSDFHIINVKIVDKIDSKPTYTVRIKQGRLVYTMESEDTNKTDLEFHKKLQL